MGNSARKIISRIGLIFIILLAVCILGFIFFVIRYKINLPGWFSAPSEQLVDYDKVYKTVDGRDLRMDVYYPTRKLFTRSPTLIYFHGGSWNSGSKKIDDDVFSSVTEYGLAFISVEYRLTGDNGGYPAFLDDCADAIRFVKKNADELQIDENRIGVIGASAGGQISLMMALNGNSFGSDENLKDVQFKIKCAVALCAPTDFLNLDVYEDQNDRESAAQLLSELFGGSPDEFADDYRAASPVYNIHKKAPPIFMAHGTKDDIVPVAQADNFYQKAVKAGMKVKYIKVENANHKFKSTDGGTTTPSTDSVLDEMKRFLIYELIL
ncbi:MAG TPA: alpha/beta hydrolase [Clostridiales bacterium]|nr:alpha/beta hydrolase [Clostridiales bacterium]